jgi:hypothetical protein
METPCAAILKKQRCCFFFSFTKLENKRAKQDLPGGIGTIGRGKR